jgi:hypothetical protein
MVIDCEACTFVALNVEDRTIFTIETSCRCEIKWRDVPNAGYANSIQDLQTVC